MERQAVLTVAHFDYEKELNAYAFFKVHNHETGEDLVQATFMKTWSYLVKEGKIDMMKSFLYHILNHLIIDEYRKHKTVSLDEAIEKGFEPGTGNADHISDALDGKKFLLLIDKLPEKYQKIIRMRYIQDLSIKEMSLLSGQSKNAITVQIHRGLEKLKLLHQAA